MKKTSSKKGAASLHFRPVKTNSKVHNEREVQLDYNRPDLSRNNQTWKLDEIANREKSIRIKCKQISGRKMQKNAEPIREAVVNIKAHHTIEDLKLVAKNLKEGVKGINCFQIHIHRDEGRWINTEGKTVSPVKVKGKKDPTIQPPGAVDFKVNQHAHMLFDWQDQKTGKTIKLNQKDLSRVQDIVAETLKMERGESRNNTNRERLESVEFKRQQEELRLQELQRLAALEQKKK